MIIEHKNIKYKFFWNGEFSNWHPSIFTIDEITFNCGEQYMMFTKAMVFKDIDSAYKILKEKNPELQKKLGRKVRNFNVDVWDEVKYELVKKGLREKFIQNPELKNYLLKHKDCQIIEASPYDRIWGIGYLWNYAIDNIDDWGENLLGKMLTELASEL